MEPSFRVHWRDYARALEQRNAALRMSAPDDVLAGWERALVREGEAITSLRNAHLAELGPYLTERAMALDCPAQMTLRYQPGYPAGQTFRDALIKAGDATVCAALPPSDHIGPTLRSGSRITLLSRCFHAAKRSAIATPCYWPRLMCSIDIRVISPLF